MFKNYKSKLFFFSVHFYHIFQKKYFHLFKYFLKLSNIIQMNTEIPYYLSLTANLNNETRRQLLQIGIFFLELFTLSYL